MAKFTSNYDLEGSLLNQTYYKARGRIFVKRKSGVSKERILTDKAFARTRENGTEFGRAATSGKLLRDAFSAVVKSGSDSYITSRLTQTMTKVKNLDTTSVRGARNVAIGITTAAGQALLVDFNFNKFAILKAILSKPYTADLATGEVDIAGFTPITDITIPEGATHVRLTAAIGAVDFTNGKYESYYSPSSVLPYDGTTTDVTLVPQDVPATLKGTVFIMLHIGYFQEVNGVQYPLNNESYNSLAIVAVGWMMS